MLKTFLFKIFFIFTCPKDKKIKQGSSIATGINPKHAKMNFLNSNPNFQKITGITKQEQRP